MELKGNDCWYFKKEINGQKYCNWFAVLYSRLPDSIEDLNTAVNTHMIKWKQHISYTIDVFRSIFWGQDFIHIQ